MARAARRGLVPLPGSVRRLLVLGDGEWTGSPEAPGAARGFFLSSVLNNKRFVAFQCWEEPRMRTDRASWRTGRAFVFTQGLIEAHRVFWLRISSAENEAEAERRKQEEGVPLPARRQPAKSHSNTCAAHRKLLWANRLLTKKKKNNKP